MSIGSGNWGVIKSLFDRNAGDPLLVRKLAFDAHIMVARVLTIINLCNILNRRFRAPGRALIGAKGINIWRFL